MTASNATPPAVLPFVSHPSYAFADAWVQALQQAMPEERVQALHDLSEAERQRCEVAIVANPSVADLQTLPKLRWVHSVWAGIEQLVPTNAGQPYDIVRLVDPELANTMAEAVLAWTLYLHRDMPRYLQQQAQRQWTQLDYVPPQQKTVSLLGTGVLGSASAQRLRQAGFRVCGWSRSPKPSPHWESFSGEDGLYTMLAQTNILVGLLPLTPATRHTLNAHTLQALPPGASLINFARGEVVDDDALLHALDRGHLAHAVLDVFQQEPLPAPAWQWTHPQVTVLPHISAPTNRASASAIVAENVRRFRQHGTLPATVDKVKGY